MYMHSLDLFLKSANAFGTWVIGWGTKLQTEGSRQAILPLIQVKTLKEVIYITDLPHNNNKTLRYLYQLKWWGGPLQDTDGETRSN
jgi:hypothetical protein